MTIKKPKKSMGAAWTRAVSFRKNKKTGVVSRVKPSIVHRRKVK